jgi:hypothetical protein
MAAHESPRTTKLYDRTGDETTLDEVERIIADGVGKITDLPYGNQRGHLGYKPAT